MKKTLILSALFLLSAGWLGAQEPDSIMQPIHAVGKVINESGEVTKTYNADFEYDTEGRLLSFAFPECNLNTTLTYEDNNVVWYTRQPSGVNHPNLSWYEERVNFTYDDWGRPVYISRIWGVNTASDASYDKYEYNDEGRLERKEEGELFIGAQICWHYWLYEYENEGKNMTVSKYNIWRDGSQQTHAYLSQLSTCLYSENYAIMSVQAEYYNRDGVMYKKTQETYGYTESGQLESEIVQRFVDDEWVNTDITTYSYDGNDHLIEYRTGVWSDELNDWEFTRKTVFQYDRSTMLYTVSFYKSSDGEWVRDFYNPDQVIDMNVFYNADLNLQEECLKHMSFKNMNSLTLSNINQFELTMQYMKRPASTSVDQTDDVKYGIFPNPGKDKVTIKASAENAVIRFYDLQGRLLLAKPFDFNITVNTGDWTPGIYLWEIWNGTRKEASGKWLKE